MMILGALFMKKSVWNKVGPFSCEEKRSGICRYSKRILRAKYLLARTRFPLVETMDIGHHKKCRKFTDFKDYTNSISPEEQRKMEFFDNRKEEILEFNKTHKIVDDKIVEC